MVNRSFAIRLGSALIYLHCVLLRFRTLWSYPGTAGMRGNSTRAGVFCFNYQNWRLAR